MAVRADEHLVVLADRELAPRQRAPGRAAAPRGQVAKMFPAPDALVARRVVDLEHCLRPRAADVTGREPRRRPRIAALVLEQRAIFVAPILTPVLHHHRPGDRAVRVAHEHHQQMLQTHEPRFVAHHVDDLGPPRLIRTIGHEPRPKPRHLQEVEAGAERARHRQDRAPVALEGGEAGLLERTPGRARVACERDGVALRRPTPRRHRHTGAVRPRERELAHGRPWVGYLRRPPTAADQRGDHDHHGKNSCRRVHGGHSVACHRW